MATSQPPRPRPRPRPIVRNSDNGNTSTPGASSSSASSIPLALPGKPVVIAVNDTDEMFMRNKNRSFRTWQKLDLMNKDAHKHGHVDLSDNEDVPKDSNHKKQKKQKSSSGWQNSPKSIIRLLSQDLSSDPDSDVEILDDKPDPHGKRKRRHRSRSRSITPPPALPEHQIQNAKNVVRQTLGTSIRPASPTFVDSIDDDTTIDFQPELSAIAQEVAEQSHHANSQVLASDIPEHIVLSVRWHPHPLNPSGQDVTWEYRVDRHDNFRDLFEATSEDARIDSANLVMTYQGKRFFPSVTPSILRIWTDRAEFVAYDKRAYEYIQNSQHGSTPKDLLPNQQTAIVEIESDDSEVDPVPRSQTHQSEAESETEGETLKLILRSSGNKDVTLTVRPTTKCGSIIKAFIKKLGLADQYPEIFSETPKPGKKGGKKGANGGKKDPRLCVEGDKMDNETSIADIDVEDGDMVEVVGL